MKNRKNKEVLLPEKSYFTIEELAAVNGHIPVQITLRTKFMKLVESGEVKHVAVVPGGKGAPRKIYTKTPVSKAVISQLENDGMVISNNDENRVVHVVAVNSTPTPLPTLGVKLLPTVPTVSANQ